MPRYSARLHLPAGAGLDRRGEHADRADRRAHRAPVAGEEAEARFRAAALRAGRVHAVEGQGFRLNAGTAATQRDLALRGAVKRNRIREARRCRAAANTRASSAARSASSEPASAMQSASVIGPGAARTRRRSDRPARRATPGRRRRRPASSARPPRAARCATTNGALASSVCASLRPSPVSAQSAPASARVEADEIRDDGGAGAELAADELQREAQAAGGARARPRSRADTGGRFRQRGEARDSRVERGDCVRGDALLRAEDRRRAALAAERVVDVRHDRDRARGKPRVEAAGVDGGECARGPRASARTGCPAASRRRTPSAASMPAPPSLVLLPPSPIMNRRTPSSRSARTSSPTPRVSRSRDGHAHRRRIGDRRRPARPRCTAVVPVRRGRRSRPAPARHRRRAPSARARAPSLRRRGEDGVERPLAAIGHRAAAQVARRATPGAVPRASAAQTAGASSEPLNESGARTITGALIGRRFARDV